MTDKNVFSLHIKEALAINMQRKTEYAQVTNGKSLVTSRAMIWGELLSLPVAKYYDWRAVKFNKQGIPIVLNDFVSMDDIKPCSSKPQYSSTADFLTFTYIRSELKTYSQQLKAAIALLDFRKICALTAELIDKVFEQENKSQAHFAMLIHILESIGFAAANSIEYSKMSNGATDKLSKALIKLQSNPMTLSLAVKIDSSAQKAHALGAGIIVNDVPSIPFLATWNNIK